MSAREIAAMQRLLAKWDGQTLEADAALERLASGSPEHVRLDDMNRQAAWHARGLRETLAELMGEEPLP